MMEKEQYILNLSLKQISLRKVAIVLWNQPDILALVNSFWCQSITDDDTIRQWQKTVENVVKEKVPMLLLPDSLKEELIRVIKPIGPEILEWSMHHRSLISDVHYSDFPVDQLYWTSVGTVDYLKTAEILIKRERLSVISSYKLACIYCLDEDIKIIWEKLSEDSKELFNDRELMRLPELIRVWTHIVKGELAKMDAFINRISIGFKRSIYQHAFEHAALSGNKAATEYFFKKLTFEKIELPLVAVAKSVAEKRCFDARNLRNDFPKQKFSDTLCYLLSQMTEEQQIQVFQRDPYKILRCFMDWPWQDLFVEVVGLMWSFLPYDKYESLMLLLARNRSMTGYNYPKLFGELYMYSPNHYRKYLIDKHREYGTWFYEITYGNNVDVIKLVLRNINEKDREGFITCRVGFHLSWRLIEDGKWFLLELFVSECRLSSKAKTTLKNGFMDYIARFYGDGQIRWRKRKWERFFQLIDNANVNDDNKRIVAEAEKEEQLIRNKPKETKKRKRRRRKYFY